MGAPPLSLSLCVKCLYKLLPEPHASLDTTYVFCKRLGGYRPAVHIRDSASVPAMNLRTGQSTRLHEAVATANTTASAIRLISATLTAWSSSVCRVINARPCTQADQSWSIIYDLYGLCVIPGGPAPMHMHSEGHSIHPVLIEWIPIAASLVYVYH